MIPVVKPELVHFLVFSEIVSTVNDDAVDVASVNDSVVGNVENVQNVVNRVQDEEPKEVQDDTGYESGQSAKVISDNVVSSTDAS